MAFSSGEPIMEEIGALLKFNLNSITETPALNHD